MPKVRRYVVSLPAKVPAERLPRCESRLLFGGNSVLRPKALGWMALMLVVPVMRRLLIVFAELRILLAAPLTTVAKSLPMSRMKILRSRTRRAHC